MSKGRKPLISIMTGMKGVGKTFQTKKVLIMDTNDDILLIMDTNDDILPADDGDPNNYGDGGEIKGSVLKSVYCNYRGFLIVYDVHGKKVHELSGEITLEKYEAIEKRTQEGITEFEGLDDYRCIACELKKKAHEAAWDNLYDPFGKPLKGGILGTANTGAVSGTLNSGTSAVLPKAAPIQQAITPPPSPTVGEIYQDINTKTYFVFTGVNTGWVELVPASPSGNVPANMSAATANMATINQIQNQRRQPPRNEPDDCDPFADPFARARNKGF